MILTFLSIINYMCHAECSIKKILLLTRQIDDKNLVNKLEKEKRERKM